MFKRKTIFSLAILITISLIVYNKWIFSLDIISYGDWGYFFKESQISFFQNSFSIWRNLSTFGGTSLDIGQAPANFLYAVLAKYLFLDFSLSERIVHLWPIVFFTTISSFFLLRGIIKNKIGVVIGVLVYMYNTYFLTSQTGHLTLMAAYSIAPLVVYTYMLALERRKVVWAIVSGLLFSLCAAYEPRAGYIVLAVLGLYFLYYITTLERKLFSSRTLLTLLFYGALPVVVFACINFYWVYALINLGEISSNVLFARNLYGSDLFSILYSLTIYHPFWTGSAIKIYSTQPILFYFWLYPIFAILGLLLNRLNKTILFFGLISLLGIFLSKQADVPFPNIYSWLYDNLPGFNAFREASKFYFLTALGYSVLIASFFSWIWESKNVREYVKYSLTVVFIAITLLNTKPFITGEMGTLFMGRHTPNDFLIVKDFVIKQDEYFRVLWVPTISRWSIYTSLHPKISVIDLVNYDWKSYTGEVNSHESDFKNIVDIFKNKSADRLLDIAAVKYVIVSVRVKDNEEDWIGPDDNHKEYVKELSKLPYLHRVNMGTKKIVVYENEKYRPHIYTTLEEESVASLPAMTNVAYRFVSPTEYKVTLKNIKSPLYINFSESYHPDWKLHIGEFNWLDTPFAKNYFLPDQIHTRNDVNFNSFYIDPKAICDTGSGCRRNNSGGYDINLTLYFKPQANLKLGMIASGLALLAAIGFIIIYAVKTNKNKK